MNPPYRLTYKIELDIFNKNAAIILVFGIANISKASMGKKGSNFRSRTQDISSVRLLASQEDGVHVSAVDGVGALGIGASMPRRKGVRAV